MPITWTPGISADDFVRKEQRTTFIFRPGGVPGGNVYTSWALLYADLSAIDGAKEIQFDDTNIGPLQLASPVATSLPIPAGNYDLSNCRLSRYGQHWAMDANPEYVGIFLGDMATPGNDVTFSTVTFEIGPGIALYNGNFAVPVCSLSNKRGAMMLRQCMTLCMSQPLIDLTGSKLSLLAEGLVHGTGPFIAGDLTSSVVGLAFESSYIVANTLSGDMTAAFVADAGCQISATHGGLTTPLTIALGDDGNRVLFDPASTDLISVNVEDAIKEVYAKVKSPYTYIVSKTETGTGYYTGATAIQDAINQALADGAADTAIKEIYVMPGTYTEDITLTGGGISLVGGFTGTWTFFPGMTPGETPVIEGKFTWNINDDHTSLALKNLALSKFNASGGQVTFAIGADGANWTAGQAVLSMDNVAVLASSTDNSAIPVYMAQAGIAAGFKLVAKHCGFYSAPFSFGSGINLTFSAAGNIDMYLDSCVIDLGSGTGALMGISAVAPAGYEVILGARNTEVYATGGSSGVAIVLSGDNASTTNLKGCFLSSEDFGLKLFTTAISNNISIQDCIFDLNAATGAVGIVAALGLTGNITDCLFDIPSDATNFAIEVGVTTTSVVRYSNLRCIAEDKIGHTIDNTFTNIDAAPTETA